MRLEFDMSNEEWVALSDDDRYDGTGPTPLAAVTVLAIVLEQVLTGDLAEVRQISDVYLPGDGPSKNKEEPNDGI